MKHDTHGSHDMRFALHIAQHIPSLQAVCDISIPWRLRNHGEKVKKSILRGVLLRMRDRSADDVFH